MEIDAIRRSFHHNILLFSHDVLFGLVVNVVVAKSNYLHHEIKTWELNC